MSVIMTLSYEWSLLQKVVENILILEHFEDKFWNCFCLFLEINRLLTTVLLPGSPKTATTAEKNKLSSTALSDGKWL